MLRCSKVEIHYYCKRLELILETCGAHSNACGSFMNGLVRTITCSNFKTFKDTKSKKNVDKEWISSARVIYLVKGDESGENNLGFVGSI